MKFVDRIEELKTLEKEYAKNSSSLVVIYGRRRTGKTTLINEFIKDKNALYFLASEEKESLVISAFQEKVAGFTGNPLLQDTSVKNWDTLFKSIVLVPFTEKPVIVIDEFQYLGKSNPAFPSIFQRIWDEILKESNVMVIICGSLISMMFSQTLAYKSPLYGRRTAQIKLDQIPFTHYNEFFPKKSYQELVESYAVTGGVPKYIESFEHTSDIFKGVSENILNKNSYLYNEPNFLLQQEVTEIGT